MGQPEPAPVPVAAQFETPIQTCTVQFDRRLTPGGTDHSNWLLNAGGRKWIPINPQAGISTVRFECVLGPVGLGNRVSYLASPPDLFGVTGTPVAQFIGFPVLVL